MLCCQTEEIILRSNVACLDPRNPPPLVDAYDRPYDLPQQVSQFLSCGDLALLRTDPDSGTSFFALELAVGDASRVKITYNVHVNQL